MKICVISNSHAASLKLGWAALADKWPGKELVFFAARGAQLAGLSREGQKLVPNNDGLAKDFEFTSGGRARISLDDYDAYLVYGLGFYLPRLELGLSVGVRQAVCKDVFDASLSGRITSLIGAERAEKVFVGHCPQRAAQKTGERFKSRFYTYQDVHAVMSAVLGREKMTLVAQPSETLSGEWNTKEEYSSGSVRLDVGDKISNQQHAEEDTAHMNAVFGQLYLDKFFTERLG